MLNDVKVRYTGIKLIGYEEYTSVYINLEVIEASSVGKCLGRS